MLGAGTGVGAAEITLVPTAIPCPLLRATDTRGHSRALSPPLSLYQGAIAPTPSFPQARRSRCPATPLQPPQPPSPWTPKRAPCPPSPASPPWPCTRRLALLPSTHCTPPARLSTTPQVSTGGDTRHPPIPPGGTVALWGLTPCLLPLQHPRPMSQYSPATPEPEHPWGPWHPPPAAGQWGQAGDSCPPTLGLGGCHGCGRIRPFPAIPRMTPCWQHRAALVPHSGPFVGASSLALGANGPVHPWGGCLGVPRGPCITAPLHACVWIWPQLLPAGVGIKPHLVPHSPVSSRWLCARGGGVLGRVQSPAPLPREL